MNLKSITIFSLVILACALPACAQQGISRPPSQAAPPEAAQPVDATFVPHVETKTQALQVLGVTRRDPFLRVRIKNVSDKNIYSFRMSYHKSGQAVLFSFILSETKTALTPGEVYKYEHSFIPDSPLAREPLTFEAVLFEDGTGDGEAAKVKSLQDLYLTSRRELEHLIALIQAAINVPEVETLDNLRNLEMKVSETPNYINGVELSGLTGLTLPFWRETTMHLIRDIEQKVQEGAGVKIQAELIKIKERFSKTLAKYPGAI